VNSGIENMNAGAARCPRAPSTQSIVHRDKRAVPAVLEIESPKFLGDEDVSFDRYYSQEFFDAEMAKIWSKVWQWACREEHIPEAGDYVTYQIGHHSILIVRTANRPSRRTTIPACIAARSYVPPIRKEMPGNLPALFMDGLGASTAH